MSSATSSGPAAGTHPPLLVVGLGASVGGITALEQLFGAVDPALHAVYVVVVHLSPDHDSRLADVLRRATTLPVTEVTATVDVQPQHVYVISPGLSLSAIGSRLVVGDNTSVEQRRSPIDVFFCSLAEAHTSAAVAVVLSGTGGDGAFGLKCVKDEGGLTIAQDPTEAEQPEMPRHAMGTGVVDYVLPLEEIPRRLAEYAHDLGAGSPASIVTQLAESSDLTRELFALVRVRTGQDFSNYKTATTFRRIARRMVVLGLSDLEEYVQLLRQPLDEASALMSELLINVTTFFRDPTAFAALQTKVLPRLYNGKRGSDQVRVWVPGCATGEEAYSIAMLLAEAAGTSRDPPSAQIFATDLDDRSIATAREALYSDADVAAVSEERLRRFFQKDGTAYRIRREIRELVVFARHNLLKDPPFSHLDLVSCRNLLIYFDRRIQNRVIETFHFALRTGGHLFLGTSESPDTAGDLFVAVDKNAHLYEVRSATGRSALPLGDPQAFDRREHLPSVTATRPDRLLPADLHHRLLEQYAPPSVVVNDDLSVVHVSEQAGRFLTIAAGEPSRDLVKLVRPELKGDIRTALHQAARDRTSVVVKAVALEGDLAGQAVNITVRPVLREGSPPKGLFLVVFEPTTPAPVHDPALTIPLTTSSEPFNRQLEDELVRMKTHLRATVEQYETQAEEAKAANEELQAMNEELRSATEELETSKEELQSVNEELTTVNQELKVKLDELGLTNSDFRNLINSTNVGTIFLDRSLRVKLSTPGAQDIFKIRPGDTGRPLADLADQLMHPPLHDEIHEVLERLVTIEHEVQTRDGRWYNMRIFPYRTIDERIDGVVLTFHDVTDRRQAALHMRGSEERLQLLIDSAVDYAIFTMTFDGMVDSWNAGAERIFGYRAHEIIGKNFEILFTPEDRAAGMPAAEARQAAVNGRADDERWHVRKDGSRLFCSGVTTRLGGDIPIGLAKIARDLTAQREAASAIDTANAALEERVQQRTSELAAEVTLHAAAEQHVTRLLRKLVSSQEEQRARIARDLHDHLGQQLTALRLTLERHRESCAAPADGGIERALEQTKSIDGELDFLAWELRPAVLDDLGLAVALPTYAAEWAEHHGVAVECRTSGYARGHLSPEAEITFYRITQEALNNILKHAHATRVNVILEARESAVRLAIEDNGAGFDVDEAKSSELGLGLANMRERAALIGATLEIESGPQQGTTIFVSCPIHMAS
jgi:two-component system, chemotaxis family, CheB/CheR fusion protein